MIPKDTRYSEYSGVRAYTFYFNLMQIASNTRDADLPRTSQAGSRRGIVPFTELF